MTLVMALSYFIFADVAAFNKHYQEYESNADIPEEALLGKNEEPVVYYDNEGDTLFDLLQNKYLKVTGYSGWSAAAEAGWALSRGKKSTHRSIVRWAQGHRQKYVFCETVQGAMGGSSSWSVKGNHVVTTRQLVSLNCYLLRPYTKEEMAQWKFGIEAVDLTSEAQKASKRNTGVYVKIVFNKSPAFYAEMQSGDIIIQLDDSKIRNTDDLFKFESKAQEGDVVKVLLLRDGREMTLEMEL